MSSSMKAAIHLGPNYLANLDVYKNTNFEKIQSLSNITQKLILEHSEGILNVNTIESASPSWTRSVLSHDQVIQWTKSMNNTFLLRFRSMLGKNDGKQRCNYKMGKSSGRIQNVSFSYKELLGIDGEAIDSSGIIFQDFRRCRFFKGFRIICTSGTPSRQK